MHPLPEGLVTTTSDPYPSASPGLVDVADVAHLWRVFNTNPRIHPGTAGHRLENLFWRIWSSGRLLSTLDGATLARLFEMIADQSSQDGQSIDKHKTTERPPPILKKQPTPHPELPKTTRLLLTSPEGQNFTRNPSNPPTPISAPAAAAATPTPPKPAPAKDETAMPKHKKTFFVASTTTRAVKRRPARRSARSARLHGPPSPSPSPPSPTPTPAQQPSPLGSEAWVDLPDGEEELPKDEAKPHLPPSFVANLRAHMKAHPARTIAAAGPTTTADSQASDAELWYSWYRQPTKTALVDRDFRSRFAERVVEARAVQAAQVAESGSSSSSEEGGGLDTGHGCCQPGLPVHGAVGHAVGSFDDGLTMASGSCAVLTDAGSSASASASMQARFNPTPGSDEVSSYGQAAAEAGTLSSGSQIRMDISFEELEELSPMVW